MATDLVRRASVAWLLIFFAVLAGSTAQSQPTPVRPLPQSGRPDSAASQMPLSEADLRTDSRLSQVLNLDVRGVEMEKIMDAVSKQTGNTLSVARKWKDRRYTGMMRRGTVAAFMLAIARTCRMSWRNLPDVESAAPQPAHRYELY